MVEGWSVEDVCEWVDKQGFGRYKPKFIENAVDGACLVELTQTDIKSELEIPVLQDRKELWNAIQRLKTGTSTNVSPGPSSQRSPAAPEQSSSPSPLFPATPSPVAGRRSPGVFQNQSPGGLSPTTTTRTPEGFQPRNTMSAYSAGTDFRSVLPPAADNRLEAFRDLQISGKSQLQCSRCGKPVGTAFVKAFNKTFHEDCFLCGNCGLPIRDSKYARKGSDPYHADCLALQQGDICSKCMGTIMGTVTTALDKKWHMNCFTCGSCGLPITDKCFAAMGDVPYHSTCEPPADSSPPEAQSATINYPVSSQNCAGCSRPVDSGLTTTALNKVWHSECFCCAKCGRPIREDKFKTDQGVPFHINCKLGENSIFCRGCHQEIHGGDIINAMDEVWHPECFKCHRCGIRIMSEKFARDGVFPIHTHCKYLTC